MNNDIFLKLVSFECYDFASTEANQEIIRRVFPNVLTMLHVDLSEFLDKFPDGKVIVNFDQFAGSSAENNILYIAAKHTENPMHDSEWFELIFTHEFIHTVVKFCWGGQGAPLFWEGVPIYLADNKLKERWWGISYHQFCKSLMEKDLLIDLNQILGIGYYDGRQDWRIDLQAGSFLGFLIEKFEIEKVRVLFKNYKSPTPENPILNINSLLEETLGHDFDELQSRWKKFLDSNIVTNEQAEQRAASFVPISTKGKKRCVFCYCPLETEDVVCKMCNAPADIKIIVK